MQTVVESELEFGVSLGIPGARGVRATEGEERRRDGKGADHTLPACITFLIQVQMKRSNVALLGGSILDGVSGVQGAGWEVGGLAPWFEHHIPLDIELT